MSKQSQVAVIGAGVVGCCIALELQRRGLEVILIDREGPGTGCSFGNSGALSPSSIVPLAMPGVLASLPGMLLQAESPLFLPPTYLPSALPWLTRFVLSARPDQVRQSSKSLGALHHGAIELHRELTQEVGVPELFLRKGHLHLYPDIKAFNKDATGWRMREEAGHSFERLDADGIRGLEPGIHERYKVGVYLADHATILNPGRYVEAIAKTFVARGGNLIKDDILAIESRGARSWTLRGSTHSQTVGGVVVAAGAWSRKLLEPLKIQVQLESQRGYHVQFDGARHAVSRTVVLADRKVFVTPMENGLRVGGTVEIAGLRRPPNLRRAKILERIAQQSIKGLDNVPSESWMGHRPCMPNSVPIVGPATEHPGLWLAIGHGHLGLTDSAGTALRIADSVSPEFGC